MLTHKCASLCSRPPAHTQRPDHITHANGLRHQVSAMPVLSDGLVPPGIRQNYDPSNPLRIMNRSFRSTLSSKSGSSQSSTRPHLLWSQSSQSVSHEVHHMPVIVVDDQSERCTSADLRLECRVLLHDRLSKTSAMPFVLLDQMDEEFLRPYWDKFNGEKLARDMAKRPERCSDRKRKAESPLRTAACARKSQMAITAVSKKRFKSASPGQSLVPVTTAVRPKKRTFKVVPDGPVEPNIFKRLGQADFFDQLVHCAPKPEIPFESPYPTLLFENLTFDNLVEMTECSYLPDFDFICRDNVLTNDCLTRITDPAADQPRAATCSPPPDTAAVSYSESCEPCQSPPQVVADHSPNLLAAAASPVRPSHSSPLTAILNRCLSLPAEQNDHVTASAAGKYAAQSSNYVSCESKRAGQSADTDIAESGTPNKPASVTAADSSKKKKKMKLQQKLDNRLDPADTMKPAASQDTTCPSSSSSSSNSSSSRSAPARSFTPSESVTDKKKKRKDEAEGSAERRRPCPHCFQSRLLLTESQMSTHSIHAHPIHPIQEFR